MVGIRAEGGRTQNRGGGEEGETHVVLSTIISARDPAQVGVCACTHLHGHGHTEHPGALPPSGCRSRRGRASATQMAASGGECLPLTCNQR